MKSDNQILTKNKSLLCELILLSFVISLFLVACPVSVCASAFRHKFLPNLVEVSKFRHNYTVVRPFSTNWDKVLREMGQYDLSVTGARNSFRSLSSLNRDEEFRVNKVKELFGLHKSEKKFIKKEDMIYVIKKSIRNPDLNTNICRLVPVKYIYVLLGNDVPNDLRLKFNDVKEFLIQETDKVNGRSLNLKHELLTGARIGSVSTEEAILKKYLMDVRLIVETITKT